MFNNNLVSSYNQYNKNMSNQNNNPLLQNPQQMNNMYQQMMQMKRMQQANIMAKMNEIERMRGKIKVNDDQLKKAIIKPIEVEKTDSRELLGKYREVSNKLESELKEHWSKRTNQPYKNILKNEDYSKNFKKKEDLIVHKVTNLDKLGLEDDYNKFNKNIEKHNNELKVVYSQNEQTNHKKKFEYNNKYKYRVKYDPKDGKELKEDNIEYYKKEQQKLEKDKKKVDDIIETLMNSDLLTKEEKDELGQTLEVDEKEIEDKLKSSKPKEESNSVSSEESSSSESEKENKNISSSTKKRIILKTKTRKIEQSPINPDQQLIEDIKQTDEILKSLENNKEENDERNKYLARKKKVIKI